MSVLTMEEMQRRIDNLEAENRELRQAALELARKKLQPVPSDVAESLEVCRLLIKYHETSDGASMDEYFAAVKAARNVLAKHGGTA